MYQAQQKGKDIADFSSLPVTVNQQGQRIYTAINFKVLKEIKTAPAQYDPTTPFTLSLLDNLGREALCPGDWKVIAPACLSDRDFLLWKAEFTERANEMALYNRRTQIPITYDMLVGSGPYYDVGTQIDFPEIAYTQSNECALKA